MAIADATYQALLRRYTRAARTAATSQLGSRTEAAERTMNDVMARIERSGTPEQNRQFVSDAVAATTGRNSPASSTTSGPRADADRERTLARIGAEFGSTVSNPDAPEATGRLAELRAEARRASSPTSAGTGNS